MNDNWLIKYKPNNLEEYDNNKEEISKIENLIYNKNKILIIKGDIGIGKHSIINLISKKYKYTINNYKLNEKKLILLDNFYDKIKIKKKKQILIINKIDYITTINEKKNIQNLNKKINNDIANNNVTIIYLVEKTITKVVKEINKNNELIQLNSPSNKLLNQIVNKIIKTENFLLDIKIINKIIELSQKDIRRLILIMKDLKYTFNDRITIEKFEKYLKYSDYKLKNYNIINTTKIIINKYDSDKCKKYYNNEKVILPLMIYENFLLKLNKKKKDNEKLKKTIKQISNLVSWGDIIETNIYTDQNWYLQKIHGYITTISTSFYINKFDSNQYDLNINFSSDLNKTSLKNINKKNFSNIKAVILNKNIQEILYINNILIYFINTNNYNDIINFIIKYNINYKLFDMITKVNKLNKIVISSSQKKNILSLIK